MVDFNITHLFSDGELTEKSDGSFKTVCPCCGLQGGRTEGFIVWPESNTWFCHSSGKHGGVLELVALQNKIITCNDCLESGEKRKVLENEQIEEVLEIFRNDNDEETYNKFLECVGLKKPWVRISGKGLLASEISQNVANIFAKQQILFYKQELREIVEVSKIKHDEEDKSFLGFSIIKPKRFITLSERYFVPYVITYKEGKEMKEIYEVDTPKSLSNDKASVILESPHFQETMPIIKRLFSVPMPMMYEGKLTFPSIGYDKRFYSWLNPNTPQIDISNMTIEKSKRIIEKIFKEFCFEKEQDYTNAVAGLLTPFLRGIFPDFTTRTPMFFYVANRERAGKDYLASVTGLTLEGQALDEPPISDGEHGSNKNDELRKKLLSCSLQGRRRLHFTNNRGRMDNSVLEGVLTSKRISDRILGKNEVVSVDNELDISASGNVGITFTPDLGNRCIFIKLFLDIENSNSREFENPDLHGWVIENRGQVLSAIFCLINDWVEKGSKPGSKKFASFPEWADICGGIMENAGFSSPCIPNDESLTIGGDTESQEMKLLFELAYQQWPEKAVKKSELIDLAKDDENLFQYVDWDKRSDQIKFGTKLTKFYGRIFSDIRLKVVNPQDRAARHNLLFTKRENVEKFQVGNVGNVGNDLSTTPNKKHNNVVVDKKIILDSLQPYQHYQEGQFYTQNPKKIGNVDFQSPQKRVKNLTKSAAFTKSDREVQFWEAEECKNIKPQTTKEQIKEFLTSNPETTGQELYEKFGTGALKFRNELKSEGLI